MAEADGDRIELRVIRVAEFLRRRHVQQDRRQRCLDPRHRDPIALGKVLQRLHLRIARHQIHRRRAHAGQRAHFERRIVLRLRPQRQEARNADACNVERAGEHRVVDHVAAVERLPFDFHIAQTGRFRALLDQLLAIHHHQREIKNPIAVRHAKRRYFRGSGKRRDRTRQRRDEDEISHHPARH